MVFFVAIQEIGLLLDMLRLLYCKSVILNRIRGEERQKGDKDTKEEGKMF
jgi:hypothetical protein